MGEAGVKILITGAHGFVGRNLTETLKAVRDASLQREPWRNTAPKPISFSTWRG